MSPLAHLIALVTPDTSARSKTAKQTGSLKNGNDCNVNWKSCAPRTRWDKLASEAYERLQTKLNEAKRNGKQKPEDFNMALNGMQTEMSSESTAHQLTAAQLATEKYVLQKRIGSLQSQVRYMIGFLA